MSGKFPSLSEDKDIYYPDTLSKNVPIYLPFGVISRSNGAYTAKGKLGFAILKIIKTGFHNIVIYDSNKTTLSCATISTSFEITVKENGYFSYLDNLQKYWSLNGSEGEIEKIVELLKSFNAIVKYSSDEDKGPLEVKTTETFNVINYQEVKEEKESDTDSSVNRRTKMSILNRMANMGQSVLPPRTISTEKTSDSSDTNDTSHYKTVRHKPVKNSMKRNSSDKNLPECQSLVEAEKVGSSIIEHSSNSVPFFTYINGQLVPVVSSVTSPSNTSGNDMNYFISEQRVSNSEIRININRMTDKVDQILGKLTGIENKDKIDTTNSFQIQILQKLLSEYENKIKMYEGFIKSQNLDKELSTHFFGLVSQDVSMMNTNSKNEDKSDKIQRLESDNKDKDLKIANLETEIRVLQNKFDEAIAKEKLHKEIDILKKDLDTRNIELVTSIKNCQELSQRDDNDNDNTKDKIKNLMNDTFRAISANFEINEEYSGEKVRAVTAAVIKKVTIESLNNL